MKKKPGVDIYLSIAFIAMSCVWLYAADQIAAAGTVSTVFITSGTFPKALAVVMIVMCIWNILSWFFEKPVNPDELSELDTLLAEEDEDSSLASSTLSPEEERAIVRKGYVRAVCLVALATAYVLVIKTLGYLVCTAILIAGALVIFGVKSPWKIILTSLITTSVLYLVFVNLLKVSLP